MSNSVFLCVKQNNIYNCYKFNSFIEADKYYNKHFNTPSTMISVFKYLPTFIQNFLIDYKHLLLNKILLYFYIGVKLP